jgi:PilZ domain
VILEARYVERRGRRRTQRVPVMLLTKTQGQESLRSGSTVDVSAEGIRVRTGAALSEGQVVYLLSSRGYLPLGYTRVVWVREADHARGNEAGLRLMNGLHADNLGLRVRQGI